MTEPVLDQAFWEWMARFPSLMGISFARLCALGAGVMMLTGAGVSYWKRRMRILPALVLGLAGGTLVVLAVDTDSLQQITGSSFLSRVRFLLGLLSVSVLAITFETIRIDRLRERYALLWLGTGGMVLLAALLPQSIEFLTHILGVQYVTAVVAVVFTFLLLVAFHFSIALSSLEDDRAKIAQRCALLELRLAKVETQLGLTADTPGLPDDFPLKKATPEEREMRGTYAASLTVMVFSVLVMAWAMQKTGVGGLQGAASLFFWFQLLVAVLAWANLRRGVSAASPFLSVLILAGMPAFLLAVLHADPAVGMTAQLVSAFFLLDRKSFLPAGLLMGAGICLDPGAVLFLPVFLLVGVKGMKAPGHLTAYAGLLPGPVLGLLYNIFTGDGLFSSFSGAVSPVTDHPLSQLGFLFMALVVIGLTGLCRPKGPSVPAEASRHQPWPLAAGILAAAGLWFWPSEGKNLSSILPAVPFLVLPLSEWCMRVIRGSGWLMAAVLVAVFQIVYAFQLGVS